MLYYRLVNIADAREKFRQAFNFDERRHPDSGPEPNKGKEAEQIRTRYGRD